ncbi:unnamed protein product [Eruca vesicaria subsp. sativa]|uniref:Pathogenesis-related protein 1 n=1 Tax=Eruca vesicaria subsp. sativa TaxID=29727 RepID=A0ABC8LRM1_ERUVS|nr:unnamed protein product [Eruca vesicaria subsp. sativa]
MATSSSTTQVIVFTVSLLFVAFQVVHADYYRPRPPVTPTPYVPKPWIPHPSPKPVYRPPTIPRLPAGSIARQFLDPHNALRSRLGLPPLVWDSKLASYATWWANQRRYDCSLTHSTGPYGENLFWGSGSSWAPGFAVQSWVVEGSTYDYNSNSCGGSGMCGHYTQMVWRDTKRLGCASLVCDNGAGVFITCNYDPPGNYVGEKPY